MSDSAYKVCLKEELLNSQQCCSSQNFPAFSCTEGLCRLYPTPRFCISPGFSSPYTKTWECGLGISVDLSCWSQEVALGQKERLDPPDLSSH